MKVLSFNLGSSSLKVAVHDVLGDRAEALFAQSFEPGSRPRAAAGAARQAIAQLASSYAGGIDAVGHRFVFGGASARTSRITPELVANLEELRALDPLHAPQALAVYRAAAEAFSNVPQVACFDTEFFRELPAVARAIPVRSDDLLLRRYGFHGLSYEYVVGELGESVQGRTIVAHLGSGSSLAAFLDGKPVDTTMGFSPLGGVVMASRPGDLDPGVLLYLLERRGLGVAELRDLLETGSGLEALGGTSDVRALAELAASGDARATFALECYVRSVAKAAGALAAVLGGLDTLVFAGGIGEHDAGIRERVAASLAHLRPATVRVVATDENVTIARHVARLT